MCVPKQTRLQISSLCRHKRLSLEIIYSMYVSWSLITLHIELIIRKKRFIPVQQMIKKKKKHCVPSLWPGRVGSGRTLGKTPPG